MGSLVKVTGSIVLALDGLSLAVAKKYQGNHKTTFDLETSLSKSKRDLSIVTQFKIGYFLSTMARYNIRTGFILMVRIWSKGSLGMES